MIDLLRLMWRVRMRVRVKVKVKEKKFRWIDGWMDRQTNYYCMNGMAWHGMARNGMEWNLPIYLYKKSLKVYESAFDFFFFFCPFCFWF